MKKLFCIIAALLMAVTLLTAMGCTDDIAPTDTAGETTASETTAPAEVTTGADTEPATEMDITTEVETAVETEPATEVTTGLADLPAGEALDILLGALDTTEGESEGESETTGEAAMINGMMDIDLSMTVMVEMAGMENTTTFPFKIFFAVAEDDMAVKFNMMGMEMDLIYVDGMLYMKDPSTDALLKCVMTPEEFQTVVELITDSSEGDEEDSSNLLELPDLEGMKPSDLFATITSKVDETTGDLHITCKGFNTTLASKFAPMLQPMLESIGLVGDGEWDENGELVVDPAATLAEVVKMLNGLTQDNLQLTFIFAEDGTLRSTLIDVTLTMEESDGEDTYTTSVQFKGSFALVEGGQTVEKPADADDYEEMDWREIFGQETADMLDLVPENGSITLSVDAYTRERQIAYIYEHFEEFEGVSFNGTGFLVGVYEVDEYTAVDVSQIGALEGLISLRDPSVEEEDYTTVISILIPVESKGEGYPAEGSLIHFTNATLEVMENYDWGTYVYLCITEYN